MEAERESRLEEPLVNNALVKRWAYATLFWLTLFPIDGVLVSIKFHNPEFLGNIAWLSFGRLRPIHVNGVIFGAFSTGFFTLVYYFVPKICGVRLYKEAWSTITFWIWNIAIALGTVSLMAGFNKGIEAGEYPVWVGVLIMIALILITIQVYGTVFRRREKRVYVALWYTMAALIWTAMNYPLGNFILPYWVNGVNSAALHGLYIHYVVGLWITPAGLALIYYFLPSAARNPLYSHKLSLIGFWSIAFLYPFLGIHHYLYSPIAAWTQTVAIAYGVLLIIPVWTVTTNFFGTMSGKWHLLAGRRASDYATKFFIVGAIFYFLGCFQGSVEALRRMQQLTHFSDFVIAHSHMTVFGTFILWVTGGLYYIWPRITGRELWSWRLASWHFWLTVIGFSLMAVVLTAMGFIQGAMLEYGANFVDSVAELKPWWIARTLTGVTMDIGSGLFFYNLWRSAREGVLAESVPAPQRPTVPARAPLHSSGPLERPSAIILLAGVAFFLLAIVIQWIVPIAFHSEYRLPVRSMNGVEILPTDYTPQEQLGRRVYIREGCWYCHSQYIRPVTGEENRWGPVSQAGEYTYDIPHLFGTRRIGPDLTRIGRKYGDDWHIAHHWDPRQVVPDSVMPSFHWLYQGTDANGAPQLTEEGKALVAYIQKLGTQIGDWRESFHPTQLAAGSALAPNEKVLDIGKEVYKRRCIGCHGEKGDGNGASAPFLNPKPRNFTRGFFKFRSTAGKDSLPLDADLYQTITHGLWGTAMPPWYEISELERGAVIQYIKTFSDRWRKEAVSLPVVIPAEPAPDAAAVERGRQVFAQAGCLGCHGAEGKGDGPLAPILRDVWGNPVRPANFTLPAGAKGGVKLGHDARHLFTVVMNGVGGTPMEAFAERLTLQQIWDVVHFVQSLRQNAGEKELERLRAGPPVQAAQQK
ncbi:MAG: cbb3-type cytochrome c oxidase subunit I [Nitrospirae bacterium]|nr:cbb3-type cytochrome c oxidase subunit I [Candidatus Manganitrophaceae bacterium]